MTEGSEHCSMDFIVCQQQKWQKIGPFLLCVYRDLFLWWKRRGYPRNRWFQVWENLAMSLNFPRSVQLSVFEPTKKHATSHVFFVWIFHFCSNKTRTDQLFYWIPEPVGQRRALKHQKDSTPHWARGRYDVHVCLHEFADIPGLPDAECGDRATGSWSRGWTGSSSPCTGRLTGYPGADVWPLRHEIETSLCQGGVLTYMHPYAHHAVYIRDTSSVHDIWAHQGP